MSPIEAVRLLAAFVPIADAIVDAFLEAHPEIGEPPPEPAKDAIDAEFRRKLDEKFPQDE